MVFTWREAHRVSKSLTVQYDKMLYLIEDSEFSRWAIGKYIDVWHYPDGHKELRLNGVSLPYSTYEGCVWETYNIVRLRYCGRVYSYAIRSLADL